MKNKYKRIVLGIVACLLVLSLVYQGLTPLSVAALTLSPAVYQDVITEEGVLCPAQQWNLFAPASLRVEEIYRQNGDPVRQGDLLLRLDDTMLQSQLKAEQNAVTAQLTALRGELRSVAQQKQQYGKEMQENSEKTAQEQIDSLQAQLAFAQDNYKSMETLYEAGAETQKSFAAAELAVKELESSLNEARLNASRQKNQMETNYSYYEALEQSLRDQVRVLEKASGEGTNLYSGQVTYQRSQTRLRAPVTGKVLFIDVKAGDLADPTKPVAAVYQEGQAGAEVYLLAAVAVFVYKDMEAQVVINGREKEYLPAMVTNVSTYAQERTSELGLKESRVKVTLSIQDNNPVIMGQKVDVEFALKTKNDALAVPKSAIFAYQDGYAVLTAVQNKARIRVIEKDFETDTMTVIKSGLQAGDTVLLTPKQEGLKEGARIRLRGEK